MAEQPRNTFGSLKTFLKGKGFVHARRGKHFVFTHEHGGPLILLPAYKSHDVVKPLHRLMVMKQLIDAGLLESGSISRIAIPKVETEGEVSSQAKGSVSRTTRPRRRHELEA